MPRTSTSFKPGESGNGAGRPPVGETLTDALRSHARRHAPGAPRGRSNAEQAAFLLWRDATEPGSGVSQARKRLLAATFIAERMEGLPLSRSEVKALIAEAQLGAQQPPRLVPWNDDNAPGVAYESTLPDRSATGDRERWAALGSGMPHKALGAPLPGDGDNAGRSPALDASGAVDDASGRVSVSAPETPEGTPPTPGRHRAAEQDAVAPELAAEVAWFVAQMQREDPTGLRWRAMLAARGEAPRPCPWLGPDSPVPPPPLPPGTDRAPRSQTADVWDPAWQDRQRSARQDATGGGVGLSYRRS